MSEIVLRNNIKILGTLPSGVGDNPLTIDNSSKEVGSISPIDLSGYVSNILSDGYILIGNASNVATPVLVGGQLLINNAGIGTIVADTIVNAQINSGAAISYSKLNIINSITDPDIFSGANITRSKLASGTAYRLVVNNASGVMSEAAVITASRVLISDTNGIPIHSTTTTTNLSSLDTTTSLTTQLSNKLDFSSAITPAEGDIIYYTGGSWNRLARGTNGQLLASTAGSIQWQTNPTTGLPTGGSSNQYLNKVDGTDYNVQWSTLVLSKITDVTATAAQVNVLATGFYDATSSLQTQLGSKLNNSLSPGALFFGNASSAPSQLSPATNGQVLTLVAGYPQWQTVTGTGTVTSVDISGGSTGLSASGGPVTTIGTITLTGTVNPTHGGTGLTSYTTGDILYASAANVLSKLAVGTDTYVLTLAAGVPTWAPPAAGSITSVTGTANRITSTGGATPVIDIAATYLGQASITTLGTIGTGVWNGTIIGVTYGGTGVNLSATGGTGQYLKQITVGGNITVGTIPAADIAGVALTRTNDTNVTLTLGGTPTTALLAATSLTVGWTGTLAYARLVNGSGLSVIGRSTNSAGVQADIAGTTDQILRVNGAGNALAFGSIDLSKSASVGSSVLGIANGGTNSSTKIWWELAGTSTLTADTTIAGAFNIGFGVTPTSKLHIQGLAAGTASMIKFQNSTPTVLLDLLEDGRLTHTSLPTGASLTGYTYNLTNTLSANSQTVGGWDFVSTFTPGAFTGYLFNYIRLRDTGSATDYYNIQRNSTAINHNWSGTLFSFSNGASQAIMRNALGPLIIRGGLTSATTNLQFGISAANQTNNMSAWNFTDTIFSNVNGVTTRTNNAILTDYGVSTSGLGVGSTVNHTFLNITPTFTMSGSTLNLTGIDWNPSVTATVASHYGILIRPTGAFSGFGTGTPLVTVDINGGLALRQQSPAQITANQNNYAIGTQTSFRLSSDASRNVTGLTSGIDGKIITIRNIGTQNIVFTHEDAASTATNRFFFSTAGNITLLPKGSITLQYDATDSRWFDLSVR